MNASPSTDAIVTQVHQTPVGEVLLGAYDGKLCLLDWRYRKMRAAVDTRIKNGLRAEYVEHDAHATDHNNAVLSETRRQLDGYFALERTEFDLPLLFVGTDFQKSVWAALQAIPYGTKTTYKELATHIGNPKAVRAVATANGANALSIVVPCHRVIGSDGQLVGYAGGLPAKRKLLQLESAPMSGA